MDAFIFGSPSAKAGYSNRWLFACLSFDLVKQELAFSLDNRNLTLSKLGNSTVADFENASQLKIWWDNTYLEFQYPEKLSLVNIFSRDNLDAGDIECSEQGDIYAWKASDWASEEDLTIDFDSTQKICTKQATFLALPYTNFGTAFSACSRFKGQIFYEEDMFKELASLGKKVSSNTVFWLPFTDLVEEGNFLHLYTNETFDSIDEYYFDGEPDGGDSENCLNSGMMPI